MNKLQQLERQAKRDKLEADKAVSRTGTKAINNEKRKAALDAAEELRWKKEYEL